MKDEGMHTVMVNSDWLLPDKRPLNADLIACMELESICEQVTISISN